MEAGDSVRLSRRTLLGAAASAALGVGSLELLAACGAASSSSGGGGAKADIKIGSVMPLTGPQAAVAKQYADGYRAYFESVNDAGGINGRKINWLIEDDGNQVARTIAGVQKLAQQDRVSLVTAIYGTGTSQQLIPVVEDLKLPMVAPISFGAAMYRPVHPLIFAAWPGYGDTNQVVSNQLVNEGFKRFALLGKQDSATDENLNGYTAVLQANQVAAKVLYQPNATDFTAAVLQILAAKPDAILTYSASVELAKIITTLRAQGFTGPIAGGNAGADGSLGKTLGSTANVGRVLGTTLVDITGVAPGFKRYSDAVKKHTTTDPGLGGCLTGYVGGIAVVAGLKKAGDNLSSDGVRKAFESVGTVDTGGLSGNLQFSAKRHYGIDSIQLTEIKNGVVTPITKFIPAKIA